MQEDTFISPNEAAGLHEEAGLGTIRASTIVYWCKQYGIGKKVGGRWKVSKPRLMQMLQNGMGNGASSEPIVIQLHNGDN